MSDTPRTDNVYDRFHNRCVDRRYTFCVGDIFDFARHLERELAEVTNHRDSAIAALEKIASLDFVITLPDRMDAVRDIAREALNKQP